MKTTLNAILLHSPCGDGWRRLLKNLGKTVSDDDPLPILTVLKSNGLDDALWALRAVEGCDREIRLLAVWCARQVQHLMTDQRSLEAMDVAERFANGNSDDDELSAAGTSAWAAAEAAAGDAAWAAARAAARAAAWAAEEDSAWAASRAAAEAAAGAAEDAAARDAARAAEEDSDDDELSAARDAAWAAARDAAQAAQKTKLTTPMNGTRRSCGRHSKLDYFARGMFGNQQVAESGAGSLLTLIGVLMLLFMLLPALNLVNLNTGRIMERSSEIGVRKPFGASSRTLVIQFVVENVLLCLFGGLLGLLAATATLYWLEQRGLIPSLKVDITFPVFFYGLIISMVFVLLSGVIPAWKMSRLHPVQALKGVA